MKIRLIPSFSTLMRELMYVALVVVSILCVYRAIEANNILWCAIPLILFLGKIFYDIYRLPKVEESSKRADLVNDFKAQACIGIFTLWALLGCYSFYTALAIPAEDNPDHFSKFCWAFAFASWAAFYTCLCAAFIKVLFMIGDQINER